MGQTFGARHALTKQAKLLTRKLFLFLYRHPFPWTHSVRPATPAFVFRHFIYAISGRSLLRSLAIHNLTVKRRGSKLLGGPHSFLLFSVLRRSFGRGKSWRKTAGVAPWRTRTGFFGMRWNAAKVWIYPIIVKLSGYDPGVAGELRTGRAPLFGPWNKKMCVYVCVCTHLCIEM